MKIVSFSAEAWSDYLYWISYDKRTLKKINKLIDEISRTPFSGSGKPEPLKFDLNGYWSRRISLKERLIYKVNNDEILIISCKGHY